MKLRFGLLVAAIVAVPYAGQAQGTTERDLSFERTRSATITATVTRTVTITAGTAQATATNGATRTPTLTRAPADEPSATPTSELPPGVEALSKACEVDLDTPWKKLGKRKQGQVLYGLGGRRIKVTWGTPGTDSHGSYGEWGMRFEGVIPNLERRFQQTASESARDVYRKYFAERACEEILSLPLWPYMPENFAEQVAGRIREFYGGQLI